MKKTIKKSIFFVSILMCILTISLVLVGCESGNKKLQSMQESVSYFNDTMFVAEDSNFYLEITKGEREKTLIADGEVGEMAGFCMINVTPISLDMTNRVLKFKLLGDKGVYEGSLEKSILGVNFSANINEVEKLGTIHTAQLIVGDEQMEYKLSSVTEGNLDYKKVVESLFNNCMDELESMFDGNKFKSEIYIKISCDRSKEQKEYYWFVNVVENSDNMFCALVDMQTGEIVAKKQK